MSFLTFVRKFSLLFTFILLFIIMSVFVSAFFTVANIFTILRYTSIVGILAVGVTLVIASGEFDISFAAIATFSGVAMSVILSSGVNLYLSWTIGMALGVAIGLINAVLVLRVRISSFVATLGVMIILDGLSDHLCGGQYYVNYSWPRNYGLLGQKFTFGVIPNPVILLLIVVAIAVVVLEYTVTGRHLYAIGGNKEASAYVGIKIYKMKSFVFIIAGLLSGLAGILTASEMGCVEPLMDNAYLLPAIAAVFLGSVFLRDGMPNIWGTFLAALFMVSLTTGLILIGYSQWLITIIEGIILLIAVGIVAGFKTGVIPTLKIG